MGGSAPVDSVAACVAKGRRRKLNSAPQQVDVNVKGPWHE